MYSRSISDSKCYSDFSEILVYLIYDLNAYVAYCMGIVVYILF